MELLPRDVVELILERLPATSLVRFKSVSKPWRSTIESPYFQEKQLIQHQQSQEQINVFLLALCDVGRPAPESHNIVLALKTVELDSSISVTTLKTSAYNAKGISPSSCDGLVCLYNYYDLPVLILNPTTRWHRVLPPSNFQKLNRQNDMTEKFDLGFGKDKISGTYKLVWLYNSKNTTTTCEVFDFSTNAWRHLTYSSTYRIMAYKHLVYVDGSLYWFTECKEAKILSFDLHTESFQVISNSPFAIRNGYSIILSNLDNRLCVSKKGRTQVIWSFDSDNKTWKEIYSIDWRTPGWKSGPRLMLPLSIMEKKKKKKKKKNKLLMCQSGRLVIHDPVSKSCDVPLERGSFGYFVGYIQSLISIL